jgi:hypothetical protein
MQQEQLQFVDPEVTRQKFNEELNQFNTSRVQYRNDGVLLMEESYPNLYFSFAAPLLTPIPLVFGVCINFTNYDVLPLSVRFVHPLNFEPLSIDQLQTRLVRKLEGTAQVQHLVQAQNDGVPFFCIPGVREYHAHPRHKGDSWLLYRKKGEGGLCFVLDNLQLYGTGALRFYLAQLPVKSPTSEVSQAIVALNNLQLMPSQEVLPS